MPAGEGGDNRQWGGLGSAMLLQGKKKPRYMRQCRAYRTPGVLMMVSAARNKKQTRKRPHKLPIAQLLTSALTQGGSGHLINLPRIRRQCCSSAAAMPALQLGAGCPMTLACGQRHNTVHAAAPAVDC